MLIMAVEMGKTDNYFQKYHFCTAQVKTIDKSHIDKCSFLRSESEQKSTAYIDAIKEERLYSMEDAELIKI